ncbi:MAG TPA: cyclic nucleotide-binding domain-containing protein [Solirubrobacteraceae bacterium]|nr:cyclic nucleotide-binding domain-containing protein [Solirubrobacteraceae bacterium]
MHHTSLGRDGPERLAAIKLFAELSGGQRQMLARLLDELTADLGEQVVREGEFGHEFLVIEQGTADVFQNGERINTLGPGDFFGEMAILEDGVPRSATVIATTPLRAIALTARFMREMRDRWPSIGEQIDHAAAVHRESDARRAAGS